MIFLDTVDHAARMNPFRFFVIYQSKNDGTDSGTSTDGTWMDEWMDDVNIEM